MSLVLGDPTSIRSNLVTCFDIDDTLIYWDHDKSTKRYGRPSLKRVTIELNKRSIDKHIIKEHVEELIRQKESGAFIIVWSASGYEWAEAVVKALNICDHVDLIMSKPMRIYDDKDPQDWMPKRRYMIDAV